MGVLPLAAQKLMLFIESTVFSTTFDGTLKTGMKAGLSPDSEVLADPGLASQMTAITDAISAAACSATAAACPADSAAACPAAPHSWHKLHAGLLTVTGGLPQDLETENTTLQEALTQLTPAKALALAKHEKDAVGAVEVGVQLVEEQNSSQSMAAVIKGTPVGKLRGTSRGQVMIIYSVRLAGESTTQPHLRSPTLRNDPEAPGGAHYRKLVQGVLQARLELRDKTSDQDEALAIDPGDCIVIADAGRHGNTAALLAVFKDEAMKPIPKTVRTLMVHYTEGAVEKRRLKCRGALSIAQTENFHFVTKSGSGFPPRRPRLSFPDQSTAGTVMGPVGMPNLDNPQEVWMLTLREKKKLYGPAARILPGRRPPGGEATDDFVDIASDEEHCARY